MGDASNLAEARLAVEKGGWRRGKPLEDPEKTKRWGFISAKPSEYLVHVRRGRVRTKSSGQGVTCFKMPWDAVSIIPTSLQRLRFIADQVTTERVGVQVVGLAVYRIADPLLAFRVLNFTYTERAQQKLDETLTSMFVGATRRLVANLSVNECLQKRKSAIAHELLRKISPVVGGTGRPDDTTAQGWGIVLDTIEIQEVRVSSETVFAAMQAPYRAALEREAREAQAEAEKEIATREAACNQTIEEARIQAEMEVGEKRKEPETAEAEAKRARALRDVAIQQEIKEAKLASEAATFVRKQELAATEARAEIDATTLRAEAIARRAELDRAEWSAAHEKRRAETEVGILEGQNRAEVRLAQARAYREEAEAEARVTAAQNLPALAEAVGQKFGEVKVTQIGGSENAFGSVTQAVKAVMELARKS